MNQRGLFDDPHHLARSGDPVSSQMAAAAVVALGMLSRHRQRIVRALWLARPAALTSNELSAGCGLRGDKVQKRMIELERLGWVVRGPVRACHIGFAAHEWSLSAAAVARLQEVSRGTD